MAQMKKPTAATVGSSGNTQVWSDSTPMISGFGAYHSNESGCKNPRPYVTVTLAEIKQMVLNPAQVSKEQAQWFIPSSLLSRSHSEQLEHGQFVAGWQDFDQNATVYDVATRWMQVSGDADYLCYASRSSTAANRKCRLIFPLAKPMGGAEWVMTQDIVADLFDEAGLITDRAAARSGQLAYLPNRNPDFYDADYLWDGHHVDLVTMFADRIGQKHEAIAKANAEAEVRRSAASQRIRWRKCSLRLVMTERVRTSGTRSQRAVPTHATSRMEWPIRLVPLTR